MSSLLVLRHGPTEWNARGVIQGRADPPLSAEGRARVRRWRIPDDHGSAQWIASPSRRALETARLMGASPIPDKRLLELDWGEWEGRSLADLRADPAADMARREALGLDFQPPGGESYRMVQDRLSTLLQDVARAGECTVAICHKGVILALLSLATGWRMTGPPQQKLKADCCHVFRLDPSGRPGVLRLNIALNP